MTDRERLLVVYIKKGKSMNLTKSRAQLLELARGYQEASALQQAVELDLFELLTTPMSLSSVAERLQWRLSPTHAFLEALQSLSLLHFDRGIWSLTRSAQRFLLKRQPESVTDMILHERQQQPLWEDIRGVLTSPVAVAGQQDITLRVQPARGERLIKAMLQTQPSLIQKIAKADVWGETQHLLDVGGGHGEILCAIAEQHPKLTGLVVDLPMTETTARACFQRLKLDDRVGFVQRDLEETDPLSGLSADSILLCRVCHQWSPQRLHEIFHSAWRVLPRHGRLIIVGRHLSDEMMPAENAAFGAYMAINFHGGWQPTSSWIEQALTALGFSVQHTQLSELHSMWIGRCI